MDSDIRFYIENRMSEMGFSSYHFKSVRYTLNNETERIDATNEYWILYDVSQITDNFTIKANNREISQDDVDSNGLPNDTVELTGDIVIDNTGGSSDQTFLFYRVIPD